MRPVSRPKNGASGPSSRQSFPNFQPGCMNHRNTVGPGKHNAGELQLLYCLGPTSDVQLRSISIPRPVLLAPGQPGLLGLSASWVWTRPSVFAQVDIHYPSKLLVPSYQVPFLPLTFSKITSFPTLRARHSSPAFLATKSHPRLGPGRQAVSMADAAEMRRRISLACSLAAPWQSHLDRSNRPATWPLSWRVGCDMMVDMI